MLRLVGIDWAWTGHAVCVLDQTGTTVRAVGIPLGRRVPRPGRPAGPARRAGRAAGGDPTPDGGLRGPAAGGRPPGDAGPRRRDQGLAPGEVVWGANSDAGNARVIAQYPRLRRHRLRVPARLLAATPSAAGRRGRPGRAGPPACRREQPAHRDLEASGQPQGRAPDVQRQIALVFLARDPTLASAAGLGERRMAAFGRRHGYRGRTPAAGAPGPAPRRPAGLPGDAQVTARRDVVLALVGVLRRSTGPSATWTGRSSPHSASIRTPRSLRPATIRSDQRRPDARLLGRPPRRLPGPQAVAALAGIVAVTKVRQARRGVVSLGVQQAPPQYHHDPRAQLPAGQPWAAKVYPHAIARGPRPSHPTRVLA